MSRDDLVAAIRAHAKARRGDYRWDHVTQNMSDGNIAAQIGKVRTANGAIARLAYLLEILTPPTKS